MKPDKILLVQHNELYPLPFQPRKTFNGIEELSDDIKARGILVPLLVRAREDGDGYDIVFGERRWRAAAGVVDELPCMARDLSDEQALELMLVELAQRDEVHPMEEALAYERLHGQHGKSVDDIALRVGKPKKHVLGRLKLCELCDEARQACLEDRISVPVALLLARIPDLELQAKALERVGGCQGDDDDYNDGPMSEQDAREELDHRFLCDLHAASWDLADDALVLEAGACSACPYRTANQRELFGDPLGGRPGPKGNGEYDVCTNPPCYANKGKADWQRRTEEAKRKSLRVLTDKEAKKVFANTWNEEPARQSGLVDLHERVDYDVDPKRRTLKALLGKEAGAHIVLARDKANKPRELLDATQVRALLKEKHPELVKKAEPAASKMSEAEKRERAETRAILEGGNLALRELVFTVEKSGAIEVAAIADFWRIIVGALCEGSWNDTLRHVCKRRELEVPKGQSPQHVIAAELSTMQSDDLAALMLEIMCTRGLYDQFNRHHDERLSQACKAFGVDYAKYKREAKKALAPKASEPAKDKAAKKPAKGKPANGGTRAGTAVRAKKAKSAAARAEAP